jgi:hypothetical protein
MTVSSKISILFIKTLMPSATHLVNASLILVALLSLYDYTKSHLTDKLRGDTTDDYNQAADDHNSDARRSIGNTIFETPARESLFDKPEKKPVLLPSPYGRLALIFESSSTSLRHPPPTPIMDSGMITRNVAAGTAHSLRERDTAGGLVNSMITLPQLLHLTLTLKGVIKPTAAM